MNLLYIMTMDMWLFALAKTPRTAYNRVNFTVCILKTTNQDVGGTPDKNTTITCEPSYIIKH